MNIGTFFDATCRTSGEGTLVLKQLYATFQPEISKVDLILSESFPLDFTFLQRVL